jgi:hypothetical protein
MTAVVSAVKPYPSTLTIVPPPKDPSSGVSAATLKRTSTVASTNATPVLLTQTKGLGKKSASAVNCSRLTRQRISVTEDATT